MTEQFPEDSEEQINIEYTHAVVPEINRGHLPAEEYVTEADAVTCYKAYHSILVDVYGLPVETELLFKDRNGNVAKRGEGMITNSIAELHAIKVPLAGWAMAVPGVVRIECDQNMSKHEEDYEDLTYLRIYRLDTPGASGS